MPLFQTRRRLSDEALLRDRRWSSLVWNALLLPAQTSPQVSPSKIVNQRLALQLPVVF